eukprot:CAMPEP_0174858630 /NCGR_PEP_ID=MMETSP1114-20130205/43406_1 /TAXON_ID=312471 /ORGANISM="Neobodo designis, Strain CCAP 1951/1" /LENGTH=36 /DNA_ID= /DNA_START= /DNA_END= /DNA_ORIENTATION=
MTREWPSRVTMSFPVAVSHTLHVPSLLPVMNLSPPL